MHGAAVCPLLLLVLASMLPTPAESQVMMLGARASLSAKIVFPVPVEGDLAAGSSERTAFETEFKGAVAAAFTTASSCSQSPQAPALPSPPLSTGAAVLAPTPPEPTVPVSSLPSGLIGYWTLDGCVLDSRTPPCCIVPEVSGTGDGTGNGGHWGHFGVAISPDWQVNALTNSRDMMNYGMLGRQAGD